MLPKIGQSSPTKFRQNDTSPVLIVCVQERDDFCGPMFFCEKRLIFKHSNLSLAVAVHVHGREEGTRNGVSGQTKTNKQTTNTQE